MFRSIFLTLILANPLSAHADEVLFLDMNASFHEIEAAEAAAKKSGRKFVAFPPMGKAERKALFESPAAAVAAHSKRREICKEKGDKDAACVKARERAIKLSEQVEELNKKHSFKEETLDAFLKEQAAAGKSFSSVIVSGHNGTGTLNGNLGEISEIDLADLLEKHGLKETVRSLHLWGCYTASPGSVMMNWKPRFPNVNFISGYDDRAPLSDKPAGWAYLKGVIEREPALHQIADAKKLQAALRKIPGATQVSAAVTNCGYYASLKEAFNLEEYAGQCTKYKAELEKRNDQYECYLQATKEGCENPPEDTSRGLVREYYGILQKTDPCNEITPDPTFSAHSREQALMLLFSRNHVGNLARIHAKELKELDEILAELNAPADLRLSGLDKLSRKEALSRLDQLISFVRSRLPNFKMDPAGFRLSPEVAKLSVLLKAHQALTPTLAQFKKECVPYSWHEANSRERSSCFPDTLSHAGVKLAMGEGASDTKSELFYSAVRELRGEMRKHPEDTYGNVVRSARMRMLQESAELPGNEFSESGAATLRWAETVKRLKDEGVEDPIHHPEALKLHYDGLIAKSQARLKEGSESSSAAEETRIPVLILEGAQAKRKLLEADISPEERAKQEAILAAHQRVVGEALLKEETERAGNRLRMAEEHLERTRSRNPGQPVRPSLTRRVEMLRERKKLLEGDPEAAMKALWEERLEKPAIEPGNFEQGLGDEG